MKAFRLFPAPGFCLVLALCLAGACPTARAGDIYKIEPARSRIEFQVGNFLGAVNGKFTKFAGTIDVDREHPERSSVTVAIQAGSIDTGNTKRDQHLRTPDFFDVKKYPEITFKSQRVNQTDPNGGEITGQLGMRGVTRSTALRVQLLGEPESIGKSSTTKWRVTTGPVKRKEFGIGQGGAASMIGDSVRVEIEIEAVKTP